MQSMNGTNMLPAVVILCPCALASLPVPAPDHAHEDRSSIFGSIERRPDSRTDKQSMLTALQAAMTHVKLDLSAENLHYCSHLAL